jgi:2-phosphoglycerate kinase
MAQRNPPNPEFLHLVPGLIRKPVARTAASDFYPYLKSAEQHRAREDEKEKEWLERKGGRGR